MAQETMGNVKSPYEYDPKQKTVRPHKDVSIPASGTHNSEWIDTEGYNTLALLYRNETGSFANTGTLEWSEDGVTRFMGVAVLANATNNERVGTSPMYARYVRVSILNGHTAPVTVNTLLYLKP